MLEQSNRSEVSALPEDFYTRTKGRLRERIAGELRSADRVLELGCGSCELAGFLAEKNGQHVIGVDISDGGFPDSPLRGEGVECHKADAGKLKFLPEGAVDAVVSVHALHEMEEPVEVLGEANRVLRAGGEILVVDFPKGSLAQRLWNEDYYATCEVGQMLRRAGFLRVKSRRIARKQLTWARGFKPARRREGRR